MVCGEDMKTLRYVVAIAVLVVVVVIGSWLACTEPEIKSKAHLSDQGPAEVEQAEGRLVAQQVTGGEVAGVVRNESRLPSATLLFADSSGGRLARVCVREIEEGEDFMRPDESSSICYSNEAGVATVDFDAPESRRLLVSLRGYASKWIDVGPGDHRHVVMMDSFTQRFNAKTEAGKPVAGIRIPVARHGLPSEFSDSRASGISMPRGADLSSECAVATTDLSGVAMVEGLQFGREYFITVDMQGMPYQVANLGDCIMSRPPYKDVDVQLRRVLAAVVDADRGSVLKVAPDYRHRPFVSGLTVLETYSVDEVKDRLRARFPGSLVFAGVEVPGGATSLKLSVLDRAGVVQECVVALRLPGEIEAPTALSHGWGGRLESAEVQFEYLLPTGVATRFGPPLVVVKQVDGSLFQWTVYAGERVELPRGPSHVRWGSEVIGDSMSPIEIDVRGNGVVQIPISRPVFAYPMRVVDRDGLTPRAAGFLVRIKTASGRSMSTNLTLARGEDGHLVLRRESVLLHQA